jgi:hypothetical protein
MNDRATTLEPEHAEEVLAPVKLHPAAVGHIRAAIALNRLALAGLIANAIWKPFVNQALARTADARDDMVDE